MIALIVAVLILVIQVFMCMFVWVLRLAHEKSVARIKELEEIVERERMLLVQTFKDVDFNYRRQDTIIVDVLSALLSEKDAKTLHDRINMENGYYY
jgi:hypothetical protein